MAKKYVYFFGSGKAEGNSTMKALLGGKGANLAEMTNIKLPVPPGFTITTEACIEFYELTKKYPENLLNQVEENIKRLEKELNKDFGSNTNPLLVSVRSGSAFSMPGMMDTILNLGLNDETIKGLIKNTNNERVAYDSYRRFINMFGDVVLEVSHEKFEKELEAVKKEEKVKLDTELSVNALKKVVERYKKLVEKETKKPFPQDVKQQLKMCIGAVFNSWNNKRAITYRKLNNIPDNLGTAVNIQAMVFGNMGDDSGTGVAFTRNPATGEKEFYGEYLINAQGEDVVAGIRTPKPVKELKHDLQKSYEELVKICQILENHFKDVQDFEFTIEKSKLYMLQTRTGKRTAQAAVKIAIDMVSEKLIDKKTAILRIDPSQLDQLLHKQIDTKAKLTIITKGLPASPGGAVGKVVFNADKAEQLANKGEKVILVRNETSPEDINGMAAAQGILTARGGLSSHAAVVARGMGKCCVAGAEKLQIDEEKGKFTVGNYTVKENDIISLNGSTGEVILGPAKLIEPEISGEFKKLMEWADETRSLKVRTNADLPRDAQVAVNFGAEGIGLCRTEHMFFEADRIKAMREMILSDDETGRRKALAKILPMQKSDFKGIFKIMGKRPVTIRLLDPPLHEFLPNDDKLINELAKEMKVSKEKIKDKIRSLHEFNPMLGHRGCRLAITYPEIVEMQVQAIFEAACEVSKEEKIDIVPEVMIPVVGHVNEFTFLKEKIDPIAEKVMKEKNTKLKYLVGTMIEVPRAALTADEIAKEAEFFSFGTNDLTQMGFGLSRDDVGKFIPEYIEKKILNADPFQTLDQIGIGQLIEIAVKKGKSSRSNLKVGICGEHGGDPESIKFCHKVGLDYVSCSPFRVPIARLAAAQAQITNPRKD